MKIDIRGLGALQQKLNKLQEDVQKTIVKDALKTTNQDIVLPQIIFEAPSKDGGLVASLKITSGGGKTKIKSSVVASPKTDDGTGYAGFNELGDSHQDPGDFMRPAINDNKVTLLEHIGRKIGEGITAATK